jgi:hypothetical protein
MVRQKLFLGGTIVRLGAALGLPGRWPKSAAFRSVQGASIANTAATYGHRSFSASLHGIGSESSSRMRASGVDAICTSPARPGL